ncbi:MAG: type VI secretion system-associated FHA domain protein TagH [Gammaproteobacteria bacterium]|nr:type VI secretion system-associated FHA domain protein TagH [Gammaproteobacteria bacterium]
MCLGDYIMSIEINLVKSPDNIQSSKVCQIFTERGGSIGRGQDNTWVIEDPERFISSVHSRIVFDNGQYYLADDSTNGTYMNGASEPIGNGNRVVLRDGDRFMLGDYEFRVSLSAADKAGLNGHDDPFGSADFATYPGGHAASPVDNIFSNGTDPFATPVEEHYGSLEAFVSPAAEETDPLAMLDKAGKPSSETPFASAILRASQPDNVDPIQQSMSWPNVIPDDWDADDASFPNQSSSSQTQPDGNASQETPLQEKLHAKLSGLERENRKLLTEVMQLRQKLKDSQNKPANKTLPGKSVQADMSMIAAMGLDDSKLTEAKKAEISETVGILMRESIAGLMQALSFRKKIKEEFRINVTTIQPVENNPLKFSANIEDAMENMFMKNNKAYMNSIEAVKESFQGISEHQVAVLAGIQAAFRGMIERLDPEALEKRFEKYRKTGVIKVGQKGKNWESYKEFHQDLVNNIDNSFQHLFGYDFVQAYEEQLQRLVMLRKSKLHHKENT